MHDFIRRGIWLGNDQQLDRMGGIWQRLPAPRKPITQAIQRSRWVQSSKAKTEPSSRVARSLSYDEKLANDIKDRALYRSLLREASYLPDEHVRTYARSRIRATFRKREVKAREYRDDPEYNFRLAKARDDAKLECRRLQRANAGYSTALVDVFLKSYGRKGSYRRLLVNRLLQMPLDRRTTPRAAGPPRTRAQHWKLYKPTLPLHLETLLRSQYKNTDTVGRRVFTDGKLQPRIPEVNTWHRPMPLIRVKTMTEAWWSELLGSVMPPLPTQDWLRLYDIVTGQRELQAPKRRGGTIKNTRDPLQRVLAARNGRLGHEKDLARIIKWRVVIRALKKVFHLTPHLCWDGSWQVNWGSEALFNASIADTIREHAQHEQVDNP